MTRIASTSASGLVPASSSGRAAVTARKRYLAFGRRPRLRRLNVDVAVVVSFA